MGDSEVKASVVTAARVNAAAFTALVTEAQEKAQPVATTEEAVKHGLFCAPTFFAGDEMFGGQDRQEFAGEARGG